MAEMNSGAQYAKSLAGILKILEFILLLICIGSVGYFLDKGGDGDYDKKSNLEFFVAAAAISGVVVIAFYIIFLVGVPQKMASVSWAKVAAGVFLVMAILLLVASSLLVDSIVDYKDVKKGALVSLCEALDTFDADSQCSQLTAGAVCGFIAVALFVVDAIVHFKM